MTSPRYVSPQVYTDYYTNQVGSGMPVFSGAVTQQGFGLGGLLARGLRAAIPFIKPLIKKGGQAVVKKALKKGSRSLARKVVNAGIDYAAGSLNDRLGKHIPNRAPAKKRRGVNQTTRTNIKKRRGPPLNKRRKSVKHRGSRSRDTTKRRALDIFDS